MSAGWVLKFGDNAPVQDIDQESFAGGKPKLPKGTAIPHCKLCGNEQSFFFQLAFPDGHIWEKNSLAVFACTSCANRDHFIPKMLDMPLYQADIPSSFLEDYQVNFALIVFETDLGELVDSYEIKVSYKPIILVPALDKSINESRVGGEPVWYLDDEGPATCDSKYKMHFLFQLVDGIQFDIDDGVCRQMGKGLSLNKFSENSFYTLFLQNFIYFYGVDVGDKKLVYVLTQI